MTSRSIQLSFFFVVFGIAVALGFFIFRPYLNVLVMAATFSIIFYPLYEKLDGYWSRRHSSWASVLTVLIASLIIVVPVTILGNQVYRETINIYTNLSDAALTEQAPLRNVAPSNSAFINDLRQQIDAALTELTANFRDYAQDVYDWVINNLRQFSQSVAQIGLAIFLWFLSFYYFLRDGHRMKELFVVFSPLSDRYDVEIVNRVTSGVKSVVGGSLIVALLQGVATGFGMWIFDVPAPALWGAVAVLAALVPTIGTALVILPAAAYLFLIGNNIGVLGLVVWGVAVVGLIDNVLRPKLIERGINVHPLLILLSVLGGISFFGPVGFLTGPIIVSLISEFLLIYNKMVLHHEGESFKGNSMS